MARSWTTLLALVLAGSALALTACNGDDDGDVSADEQEIIDAITESATGNDPAACTEVQTQNFVEQTTGETGQAAVKSCQEEAGEAVAEEADVSNIEIADGSATAETALTGSFFDGQTIEIGLVEEGDVWKLDELVGFAELDREAFVNAVRTGFEDGAQGAPPGAVDCVTQNLEGLSDEQFEQLLLFNDRQLESQVFDSCFEGQQQG